MGLWSGSYKINPFLSTFTFVRFPKGERCAIVSKSWSGAVSVRLQNQHRCPAITVTPPFLCLFRKINRDDVVILDSLNYIKGTCLLLCFSIIFMFMFSIIAFLFELEMLCRLQVWTLLSGETRTDPPLSGEHSWWFKVKIFKPEG